MCVPYDEVQVTVFAGLLTNKGIDTPTAVQPYVGLRRAKPPKNLDDIRRSHGQRLAHRPNLTTPLVDDHGRGVIAQALHSSTVTMSPPPYARTCPTT
jgi:hypothetical protein